MKKAKGFHWLRAVEQLIFVTGRSVCDVLVIQGLTPAKQVVPHEVLLLGEHGHHDERVQVDSLAQHPEVVAAEEVEVDEERDLAAGLRESSAPSHFKGLVAPP